MDYQLLRNTLQLIFLLSFLVLVYHWLFYYAQLLFAKQETKEINDKISVIIAFKDESKKLKNTLEKILGQQYPNFEIILINDHSSDDYQKEIPNSDKIKLHHLPDSLQGKKQAIKFGIEKAESNYLLFVDADCIPASSQWMTEMVQAFDTEIDIVLGYSKFKSVPTILNKIVRYETFMNGIQYLSFALNGRAYMGVGRNLGFKKSLIQNYKPELHSSIRSGDDDLRVNQLATKVNTSICVNPSAITVSEGKKSLAAYIHQRRRQLEAGNYYKTSDRVHLALIGLAQFMFSVSLVFALFDLEFMHQIYSFILIKFGLQMLISFFLSRKMDEKDLWFFSPIIEVVYIFLISAIGVSTWVWKVDRWK